MFTWLASLPMAAQMTLGMGVVALLFVIMYVIVQKGANIKYKDMIFSVGNKKTDTESECPDVKDVIIMLNSVLDIYAKKFEIKHYKSLRSQMNYAEERSIQVLGLMQKIYLSLLRDKGVEDIITSMSFQAYRLILLVLQKDLEKRVREALRENNLCNMSDAEFREYACIKIDILIGHATSILNEIYFYQNDIDRETLLQENMKHIQDIKRIFLDVFERARKISIDVHAQMDELDEQLSVLLQPFTGVNIKINTGVGHGNV